MGSRIEPMLARRATVRPFQLTTLVDFNMGRLPLDMPTVLYNLQESGKTPFALAHFDNPLVVRHLEDLKQLNERHDGLVFDDCNLLQLSAEETIHLLEFDQTRSIKCRYSNAQIPADMAMIFTTNMKPKDLSTRGKNKVQRRAIARRYTAIKITARLQVQGTPFTAAQKRARREAGVNGPQGP